MSLCSTTIRASRKSNLRPDKKRVTATTILMKVYQVASKTRVISTNTPHQLWKPPTAGNYHLLRVSSGSNQYKNKKVPWPPSRTIEWTGYFKAQWRISRTQIIRLRLWSCLKIVIVKHRKLDNKWTAKTQNKGWVDHRPAWQLSSPS